MSDHEHEEKKEHSGGHGHGGGGHHGGGSHEEHEGAPEWLISFADNVTLMMGFFVILLAMNMSKPAGAAASDKKQDGKSGGGPTVEMLDATIAIREAFHNPVDVNSSNPNELSLIRRVLERTKEGFNQDKGIPGKKHDVQSIRPGNFKKPAGAVTFNDDSSEITPGGKQDAIRIAKFFSGMRTILELRGHVSAAEGHRQKDRGMKLSFDRAMAVASILAENGIDWRQMRILVCMDNDRLKPLAYDDATQRENERVEVIPTDEVMPVYVPQDTPDSKPRQP